MNFKQLLLFFVSFSVVLFYCQALEQVEPDDLDLEDLAGPLIISPKLPQTFALKVDPEDKKVWTFNGRFAMPKELVKNKVKFSLRKRAAVAINISASHPVGHLDLAVDGDISSSFGGIHFKLSKLMSSGKHELIFMWSKNREIKKWYNDNLSRSANTPVPHINVVIRASVHAEDVQKAKKTEDDQNAKKQTLSL